MLSRFQVTAALLGLFLTGPAIADDRPPVAYVDVSALTIDSDFTVFMHREVPQDVQRTALRKLWLLMQLPVSCHDLCYEPEPLATAVVQLATEKMARAAR